MANQEKKVYYFETYEDEFGPKLQNVKKISGNYKYNRDNVLIRLLDFVSYRLILTPLAFLYRKVFARIHVVGKKSLRRERGGVVIYANHTHPQADAFGPSTYTFPRKINVVVGAANVSLPVLGGITKQWGALPLPEDYESSKNFMKEVKLRLKRGQHLLIYPEAHIWPWYTLIRPFTSDSFLYPLVLHAKVYTFTTTYATNKRGKLKRTVYIDGPFRANENLSRKGQAEELRKLVYDQMRERALNSTYEKVKYIKKEAKL